MDQGDLTVGAQVDEQGGLRPAAHTAGPDGGIDIGPHKGPEAGRIPDARLLIPEEAVGLEGSVGQGLRVPARVEIEHGGVAGDDGADQVVPSDASGLAGLIQQVVHRLGDHPAQDGTLPLPRRLDAADHIG